MPIPTPNNNESEEDFIGRCMVDLTMKKEYDDDQRLAICQSQFENKNNSNMKIEKKHIKEIVEDDDNTITVVFEKDEEWEGIKLTDSDTPGEGDSETIEENDEHLEEDPSEEEMEEEIEDEEDEEDEERDEHEELEDEEGADDEEVDDEEEVEEIEDEKEEEEEDEEFEDDSETEEDEEYDEEEDEDEEEEEEEEDERSVWEKKDTTEKRFFTVETRVKKKGKRNIVEGHAAVYGELSEDLGGFREMIKPGAFDDVLENDVRAFFNHDPNYLLARTSSGTLKLSTDKRGLKYSFDVPDTTAGRDLLVSMKRGDITQSSFAFIVESDSWDENKDGQEVRTIEKVSRLYDVSPVSIPAYPSANDLAIAQRSRMIHKDKTKMDGERAYEYRTSLLGLKINILKRK